MRVTLVDAVVNQILLEAHLLGISYQLNVRYHTLRLEVLKGWTTHGLQCFLWLILQQYCCVELELLNSVFSILDVSHRCQGIRELFNFDEVLDHLLVLSELVGKILALTDHSVRLENFSDDTLVKVITVLFDEVDAVFPVSS